MGGDGQATFHVQALTNLLDYGMEIQEAIERPRFLYGPMDPGTSATACASRPVPGRPSRASPPGATR